jgi:mannosidase alpha-like ER degradation enhancer 3
MAIHGIEFMQEMVQLNQQAESMSTNRFDRLVQIISEPVFGKEHFIASPAQFGPDLSTPIIGKIARADPYNGCEEVKNPTHIVNKIAIVRRGECMFQEKLKNMQDAGAIAVIVIGKLYELRFI